jgi:serine/threonine-protein kinase HipA
MSLNGKRENFKRADFYSLEKLSPLFSRRKVDTVIDETIAHVSGWPELAREWEVPKELSKEIEGNLRLDI